MLRTDEDALICDFAQYYHVLNYRSLPAMLAATFLCGLPDDSRCKMKITGRGATIEQLMLAMIYDGINWLCWAQTKDAAHGRNRPKSLHDQLVNANKQDDKPMSFSSAEEFEAAWREGVKDG